MTLLDRIRRHPLRVASVIFIILSIPLAFNMVEMKDTAAFTNSLQRTLEWGFPINFNFKFGNSMLVLGSLAQITAPLLHLVGVSILRSKIVAWKIELITASVVAAYVVRRIAQQLGSQRPHLPAIFFLFAPSTLLLGPGYGEIEIVGTLCVLLATTLFLDDRWELAAVAVVLGAGIEYWPIAAVFLPLVYVVRYPSTLKLRRFWRSVGVLVVGLAVQFSNLLIGGDWRNVIARTVEPVQSIAGPKGPTYPFSLWLIGFHRFAYNWWLVIVALVLLALLGGVVKLIWKLESDRLVYHYGMAVTGGVIALMVLFDPRSNVQYCEISLTGITLLVLFLGWEGAVLPIIGSATFAFMLYRSLNNSWIAVSGTGSQFSWSTSSNIPLMVIIMTLGLGGVLYVLVRTGLAMSGKLSDPKGENNSFALVASVIRATLTYPLIEAVVVVALLSAQPALWTGFFSQNANTTSTYDAMTQVVSANAINIVGNDMEEQFNADTLALQNTTRIRPQVIAALTYDGQPDHASLSSQGVVSQGNDQCARVFRLVGNLKTFHGVLGYWLIGVISGRPGGSELRSLRMLHAGNVLTSNTPAFYYSKAFSRFAFQINPTLLASKGTFTLEGPCSTVYGVATKFVIRPSYGVSNFIVNTVVNAVNYSVTDQGVGTAVLPIQLQAKDYIHRQLSSTNVYQISSVELLWPTSSSWIAPLWTSVVWLPILWAVRWWWWRRRRPRQSPRRRSV